MGKMLSVIKFILNFHIENNISKYCAENYTIFKNETFTLNVLCETYRNYLDR